MTLFMLQFTITILFLISNCGGNTIPGIPDSCQQPPNTSLLIYNMSDIKHIKTQVTPTKECECLSDPINKIVFFKSVAIKFPTTGIFAGASTINMH